MACQEKFQAIQKFISIDDYIRKISEIDHICNDLAIWNDHKKAAKIMKERQKISDIINKYNSFKDRIDFLKDVILELIDEIEEYNKDASLLLEELSAFEISQVFKDEVDSAPAILTINAGAGGLEAANWVTMLLRMYLRYASNNNFTLEILDTKPSEEHSAICTDSVSIRIEGNYAYGFFKGESGVHRLIRNSPFSANDTRHTSFAAVSVIPDIEDTIEINILDKDMEISAMRSGGSGGQHQNVTNSACRIKHLPTGINIAVRNERDFHQNKRTALKMLKAKLYDLELKKQQSEKDKQLNAMSDISFGHQIRSYILDDNLIKDHRTGEESNNTQAVLDGDLNNFIMALLRS
jgi:peptide chain release factor 2